MEKRQKKKTGMKDRGARQETFLGSGIWHLQGIERGVPKAARQSGEGYKKKTKRDGDKSSVQEVQEIISKHGTARLI
jgi:hypothetical protein